MVNAKIIAFLITLAIIGLVTFAAFFTYSQFLQTSYESNNNSSTTTEFSTSTTNATKNETLQDDIDAEFPSNYKDRTAEELSEWKDWKLKYGKSYSNNKDENLKRQAIFLNNLRWIKNFNKNTKALYKLAINHFADLTQTEINNLFIGPSLQWSDLLKPLGDPASYQLATSDNLSELRAVSWIGKSGPVVDQGMCRASAVYASVANIESYYNMINASKQVRLSEAQLFDCLLLESNAKLEPTACSGGLSSFAVYNMVQKLNNGLVSDKMYNTFLSSLSQKDARSSICDIGASETIDGIRVKIDTYGFVNHVNITQALGILGPLTVAIDASKSTFHFYGSGIYHDDTCDPKIYSHHMLIVGYTPPIYSPATNTTVSKLITPESYIMKNSFGGDWGEQGYVRFLVDTARNKCLPQGIALHPNLDPNST